MFFIFRALRWAWSKRRLARLERKAATRQLVAEAVLRKRPWPYLGNNKLDRQLVALIKNGQISTEESRVAWQKIRSARLVAWQKSLEAARLAVAAQKERLSNLGSQIRDNEQALAQAREKFSEAESAAKLLIDYHKCVLKDLGSAVCQVQQELAQAQRQLSQAEAAKPLVPGEDGQSYDAEFAKLCSLPGIRAVRVSEVAVEIVTKPIIATVRGRYYDLGDYQVIIRLPAANVDHLFPRVYCLFSTIAGFWRPLLYGGDGTFCFGTDSRASLLRAVLEQGEYVAAVILILEGLQHINPRDEDMAKIYPEIACQPTDQDEGKEIT